MMRRRQPSSKRGLRSVIEQKHFERIADGATVRFKSDRSGLYWIILDGAEGASGADIKRSVNDAFGWMFVNTDAFVLRGTIADDNKQCLAMCPHFIGRLERGSEVHVFTSTLARWAKVYGIEKAISEIRAAGQTVKADKLEAAAKAAGVI